MVAAAGVIIWPFRRSVGIQYAAFSPDRLHVVEPARSVRSVEKAFVVVLPTKLWSCDAPGWRGYTIGSSIAIWLKVHEPTKFTPCSARMFGAGPAASLVCARMAIQTATPSATAARQARMALTLRGNG